MWRSWSLGCCLKLLLQATFTAGDLLPRAFLACPWPAQRCPVQQPPASHMQLDLAGQAAPGRPVRIRASSREGLMGALSPGWVRYAERVLGHPVTPHLCTAKSPQQIMGSLVKDYFARRQVSQPLPRGQHAGQETDFPGGWVVME